MNLSFASYWPDPGPDLPRIYIRSNGDVQPETSLIAKTGNIYKLTGDVVNYTVYILCDNIVLDGAGYSILGDATRIKGYDDGNNGVIVDSQKNLTIQNINFEQGATGVRVFGSSNVTIVGNNFSNGILTGINLQDCAQVLIENNSFTELHTDVDVPAVLLNGTQMTFRNNTITGSSYGLTLIGASNVVTGNTIECVLPMELDCASENIVSLNIITGPPGWSGREPFTGNEGISLFRECNNNIIFGNNITGFVNQAIRTVFTCSNNTFYGNYIADTPVAVVLQAGAVNNTFYGNFFASGSCTLRIDDGVEGTSWDNGTIGNYWGDYDGTDNNQDGIGDSPYLITAVTWDSDARGDVTFVGGQDNYPLMNPIDFAEIPEFPNSIFFLLLVVGVLLVIITRKRAFQDGLT